ncbi:tRNA modification GTPase gtpbp3, mitochondrial [Coelomomyces lativittatus]|nr:tRNA modification GTPase gtpbp3, mitochondrial [Coelomomyces lativittatus]KAJ1503406.1 tRNA modification GTPase gtpbp3, mitochondrial [Coelomomyces lativittatus]
MVTAYPGTTRDIIETHVDIGGYPVHLGDTAGLRETKDPIEQQGIQLAKERLRTSQLKIGVLAASSLSELLHQWQTLQPHFDSSTVIVLNKVDTPLSYPVPSEIPIDAYISLKNMIGLDTFQTKLVNVLSSKYPPTVSLQERHVTELQMAIQQLTHFLSKSNFDIVMGMENLKQAHFHLGRLVGKNVNIEDILDIVFRDFCIGK